MCNDRAIKRGGGVKGQAIREQIPFLGPFFQCSKISTAIKLEGGRGVRPTQPSREDFFFSFPNVITTPHNKLQGKRIDISVMYIIKA